MNYGFHVKKTRYIRTALHAEIRAVFRVVRAAFHIHALYKGKGPFIQSSNAEFAVERQY